MAVMSTDDLPLVSICIPAYNAASYAAEAVESALGQTYPNIEVICIDDGSKDATPDILGRFGDSISFERTPNRGAQLARNRALSKARGAFVHFLDSDNYLLPTSIETKVRVAQATGADLVFSNEIILKDSGEKQHLRSRKNPEGIDPFVYCLKYNVPGGTTAIETNVALHKTEMVRKVGGFRHGVAPCDDKDLVFRLTAAGATLAYVDEELCVYRDHSGPRISTAPRNPAYPLDYFVGLIPVITQTELYDLNPQRAAALADLVLRLAKDAFRMGERTLAKRAFEQIALLGRPTGRGESLPYRLCRSALGYSNTESLRALYRQTIKR